MKNEGNNKETKMTNQEKTDACKDRNARMWAAKMARVAEWKNAGRPVENHFGKGK